MDLAGNSRLFSKRTKMILKNNQTCNVQLYYHNDKDGELIADFVHIPAGATVEIDDKIYHKLCASRTRVEEMARVDTVLDTGDVDVVMDKKKVTVAEFEPTGKFATVNLFTESVKSGAFTIVQRAKVEMSDIDKVLVANQIDIKAMPEDAKLAIYDKLV